MPLKLQDGIEPMGVYSKKLKDLNNVPSGAKVAIPNDPTNGGRALALLQSAKLPKLRDGVGISGTPGDIVDNPKNLQIVEIEAALLPRSMDDVDLSVINSNFKAEVQLNPAKVFFTELKIRRREYSATCKATISVRNCKNWTKLLTSPREVKIYQLKI